MANEARVWEIAQVICEQLYEPHPWDKCKPQAQRAMLECARAIAALPVHVSGEPVAWLRDAQPDAEDKALVICNRIDPGAFPVFASPPAPASQVLSEADQKALAGIRTDAEADYAHPPSHYVRQIRRLIAIIDRTFEPVTSSD